MKQNFIISKNNKKSLVEMLQTKLVILLFIGLAFSSCSDDDILLYDTSITYLQFGPEEENIYSSSYDLADTTKSYTFVYENSSVIRDTIYFDLYAIGGPKDEDRPIAFSQVTVENTLNAEPGVHYVAFDDNEVADLYVIPAGEVHLNFPIILLRHSSLETASYVIKIVLEENDYFSLGDSDLSWRKVYTTDELIKPSNWTNIVTKYYFGKYSKTKHRFLIDETGEEWDYDFLESILNNFGELDYWRTKVKSALAKYNNANPNNELRDENGALITFPS